MQTRTTLAMATAALLGLVSAPAVAQSKPAVKVKVFCQLQETPGGFVNPEIQDALKDVRQAVEKKKDWLEAARQVLNLSPHSGMESMVKSKRILVVTSSAINLDVLEPSRKAL